MLIRLISECANKLINIFLENVESIEKYNYNNTSFNMLNLKRYSCDVLLQQGKKKSRRESTGGVGQSFYIK